MFVKGNKSGLNMRIFLLILTILVSAEIAAQDKYIVFFTDKGTGSDLVQPGTQAYHGAVSAISDASIERRIRTMGEQYVTIEDVPVNKGYISGIEYFGVRVRHKLKWLNAVSFTGYQPQADAIGRLPYVSSVRKIRTLTDKNRILAREDVRYIPTQKTGSSYLRYGLSEKQLSLSDVIQVHRLGFAGRQVRIGVLDTGFDWKRHESLRHINVLGERDFVFGDDVTADESGDRKGQDSHGTAVLSAIGGYKEGHLIGAAYNASFILAKTEDVRSETHVEEDNYAAALEWMDSIGVDITTSSLGYTNFDSSSYTYENMDGKSTIVTRAAEIAFKRGIFTLTAAGNQGDDAWYYINAPADGVFITAVGAVYPSGELASFSSRGPSYDGRIKPDVSAMGVAVYGAASGTTNEYEYNNGTSLSTPIVAGITALLLSVHPHLTNLQLRHLLKETASQADEPDVELGYGIVSAYNAIRFPNMELKPDSSYRLHLFSDDNLKGALPEAVFAGENQETQEVVFIRQHDDERRYQLSIPQFRIGERVFLSIRKGNEITRYAMVYGDPNIIALPEEGTPALPEVSLDFDRPAEVVVSIADRNGKPLSQISSFESKEGTTNIVLKESDVAALSPGIYFISVSVDGQLFMMKRFVI